MYLYDRQDWPQFRIRAAELLAPLSLLRLAQGRLQGRMESVGFAAQTEAALDALTQEAVHTSEIEGEALDYTLVRSSFAQRLGVDVGALPPPDRYVEGLVDVMLDATTHWAAPLTEARLFDWHAALFPVGRSGLRRITVGAWRTGARGPMQVVSGRIGRERVHFEAPPAAAVPPEMARLLDWCNAPPDTDAALRVALAHLWFVTIHPFEDGNGRIGRALAEMMIARAESGAPRYYSLSAQLMRERADYYRALETAQRGALDVTDWAAWFIGVWTRAIASAETTLAGVIRRARFWAQPVCAGLNDRQRKVLARLLDGFEGKLSSSKYAKLAACSQDTALRDIQELVRRGLLAPLPAGGRSAGYELRQDV